MKPSKQQQQLQQSFASSKQNYISKNQQNEKQSIQNNQLKEQRPSLAQYKPQNVQNTSYIRIIENFENDNKENLYQKLVRKMDVHRKSDENQGVVKCQKQKKKMTIEVEQNQKQRSYSALPILKRWSPTENMNQTQINQFWKPHSNENEQTTSTKKIEKKQLYFAYFWIDQNYNSFMPTFCPLNQENLDKCYNQLLHLLKYNFD